MERQAILDLLVTKADTYNCPDFIEADPISIPHSFSQLQDIEIAGFFAAMFSWGQRKTIINKTKELLSYMDQAPYDFVCHHSDEDLKKIEQFKHRTFNATDALYFISFFKHWYSQNESLESAFSLKTQDMQARLTAFNEVFFRLPYAPDRTRKHVSTPAKKSACKRLNMYLRWMVRQDDKGVDFGLWKSIPMQDLVCPLDVHVDRVARKLGLLQRKQSDWQAAIELTNALKTYNPYDPVVFDYALFGLGIEGRENF